jgi:hypothetical protein
MDDLIFVGTWLAFPIRDFRGLKFGEWADGPRIHSTARLFLAGVPGGFLPLGDTEYNLVWDALQEWQEMSGAVKAWRKVTT